MRAARQFALLSATAVLLTGCGLLGAAGTDAIAPPTRPTPIPSNLLGGSGSDAPSSAPSEEPASPSSGQEVPAPDLSAFYDQKVAWKNCGPADCATIEVPLDYSDPEGPTLELALARVRATGDKIGSLFVNPGGPGGSAVGYAKSADYIVTSDIRDHFDIVGLEPRGVGRATGLNCLSDREIDEFGAADGTPDSVQEEQEVVDLSRLPGERCLEKESRLLPHVGTVDSARDLDVARHLVGDDTLSYLGKSYGTQLGATYAELFPDRVGRMVLDGVLPADLDQVTLTKGQADAFELMVRDFAAYCLDESGCPLDGSVDGAVRQLQEWFTSLDANPLPGRGGESRDLNEGLATYAVLLSLYFPGYDYPRLRDALSQAMDGGDPTRLFELLDARLSRGPDGHYVDNSNDAFYAISCLDHPFEGTVDDIKRLAEEWKSTAPTFGPALAWGLLVCKDWPVTAERIGSTVAEGSNPILVVSTRTDPATPYQWGVQLAKELDNGHLVTYEGRGHTAYHEGSRCVDEAVDDYLLKGTVPAEDPDCR